MGRRNKVRMPSSEGGIVRYFEDEHKARIMIEPKIVIILVAAVAIVSVALRLM
ncbi:preprotein translocase subunit Sec61beta [Candidatus Woesearchaeota archaeon]|jgi:preprotein translocase subunit Sec61beta|nr:preprotein translocase subunit Sec61beta [Candidatus Woesearchaeota archaeon]MBT7402661.1 preprotein translocase subunit Sec61beta [Candidatus Woesearchaeota archaeon]